MPTTKKKKKKQNFLRRLKTRYDNWDKVIRISIQWVYFLAIIPLLIIAFFRVAFINSLMTEEISRDAKYSMAMTVILEQKVIISDLRNEIKRLELEHKQSREVYENNVEYLQLQNDRTYDLYLMTKYELVALEESIVTDMTPYLKTLGYSVLVRGGKIYIDDTDKIEKELFERIKK